MHRTNPSTLLYAATVGSALAMALAGRPSGQPAEPRIPADDWADHPPVVPAFSAIDPDLLASVQPTPLGYTLAPDQPSEPGVPAAGAPEPDAATVGFEHLAPGAAQAIGTARDALEQAAHLGRLARQTLKAPFGLAAAAGHHVARPTLTQLDEATAVLRARLGWYLVGAAMTLDRDAACDRAGLADAYADGLRLSPEPSAGTDAGPAARLARSGQPATSHRAAEARDDDSPDGSPEAQDRDSASQQTSAAAPAAPRAGQHPRGSRDWIPAPVTLK